MGHPLKLLGVGICFAMVTCMVLGPMVGLKILGQWFSSVAMVRSAGLAVDPSLITSRRCLLELPYVWLLPCLKSAMTGLMQSDLKATLGERLLILRFISSWLLRRNMLVLTEQIFRVQVR